jgi:hypothetical protein
MAYRSCARLIACARLIVFGVLVALCRPAAAERVATAGDQSTGAPGAAAQTPVPPPVDLGEELPLARPADLAYGVAVQLRWISVPSWLLNSFTKKNVPLSSWGTGISGFRRKGNFDFALSFNYQNMSPPDGNWLGSSNKALTDTSFLHFRNFALYGFDMSFIWHAYFTDWFGLFYGGGVGIGILSGYIERTKNLNGDCTDANAGDPTRCTPTPGMTSHLANVPAAVPIFNAQLGVDFRLPKVRGWEARLSGGFYDAFYLGGGVGYTF